MVFAARQQTHDNPQFMQTVIANRSLTPVSNVILVLQPLGWLCVEYALHHERDVDEE